MTVIRLPLKYILGALLLGSAASSFSVSLGRMRGATLVGQPLDATLTAQLGRAEELSTFCASAEVFFGDSQIAPSRVSTSMTAGTHAGEVLIRIQTSVSVNEPVVTVYLSEGCAQKNTRKYVLFAEVSSSNASQAPAVSGEAVRAQPPVQPLSTDSGPRMSAEGAPRLSQPKAATAKVRPAKASPASTAAGASPGPAAASVRAAAKVTAQPPRKPPLSRLKLEAPDLMPERGQILRTSPELVSRPAADAQQQAAAAAHWQTLQAQPEERQRDNQRLKSLEADVARMLAQGQQTEKAVRELQAQLEQSRSERYTNWLVYVLGALLVLASLVALLFWGRSRRSAGESASRPWWRKNLDRPAEPAKETFADPKSAAGNLKLTLPGEVGGLKEFELDFDLSLNEPKFEVINTPPAEKPLRPFDPKNQPNFLPSISRSVKAEELFDVQQQANFFVSLGDLNKAAEVLRQHIREYPEDSAPAYLDLFELYQRLGRSEDYELLRKDFNNIFNAEAPRFDEYAMDGRGLEGYEAVLARLESLWATPLVLELIDEWLFRKPGSVDEVFSLKAYGELLLLQGIAKKVAEQAVEVRTAASGVVVAPSTKGDVNSKNQSSELSDGPTKLTLPTKDFDPTRPPVSHRLGLDIDLSQDFSGSPAAQPKAPQATRLPQPGVGAKLLELEDFPLKRRQL
ncbi:hypothetical protein SAMN05216344_12249 [Polaromonas sp. OV174]|uniref:type IV pilus assembly protein FimV n=1 Tax=Polaromonas sp. OV174 TaxID=1855300 RepID=UPI0008EBB08B|nr:hypothetical protein [Polaromonas sp. OV174]SFC56574.1 hypothetical protein SAMN05216344_12249 [Polaromonas sp. OV174]